MPGVDLSSFPLVPLDAGMTILSAHLDYDLSKIPLDAKMTDRKEPELQRMLSLETSVQALSMLLRCSNKSPNFMPELRC